MGYVDLARDVKKIRTCEYPRIKPSTGRKQILKMDTRYPRIRVFFIHAGTSIFYTCMLTGRVRVSYYPYPWIPILAKL